MKILLTAFDPFGGDTMNTSWAAVQRLDGLALGHHRIVAAQLPTVFGASLDRLDALLDRHRPDLIVCTGEARGRRVISLERVAINVDDARIADNAGAQPVDEPVAAGGPAAYFSRLPLKAMLAALQAAGVPAEVSQTAGTFVCNHVFYGLMHRLAGRPELAGARGGFIHVPPLAGEGADALAPGLPLEVIAEGLRLAIATALLTHADLRLAAGAID